jgi:hypothetical protein
MTVLQKPAAKKSKYIESGSESEKKSDKESDEDTENEVHEEKSKVVHEGNKPIDNSHHKCPDCHKIFPTPSKLQSHYCCGVSSGKSVDHAKKSKEYEESEIPNKGECKICHENIIGLKSHYESCKLYFNFMTKLKHGFRCKICKLKISTQARTAMYIHIKRMHPNRKVQNGNVPEKRKSDCESDKESDEESEEKSDEESEIEKLEYVPKKGKHGAPAAKSAIPVKKSKVVHEGNKTVDNKRHECPDCYK